MHASQIQITLRGLKMAVRFPVLCLVLLVAAGRAAGGPPEGLPKVKPGVDPKRDPAWLERVHKAIDEGVAWLLKQQKASGRFPAFGDARGDIYPLGMHALGLLAVVKGGHPTNSPEVQRAYAALHATWRTQRNALKTYEVGLTLMVLEARYSAVPPRKRAAAERKGRKPKKKKKPKVAPADLELAKSLLLWLESKQRSPGMWRYPEEGMDLSNTQYAVLGLWAAHDLGLELDRGVLRRAVEITLARQQTSGPAVRRVLPMPDKRYGEWVKTASKDRARGWRYMPDHERKVAGKVKLVVYPHSGSMTSAGIAVVAVGRHLLKGDPWLNASRDRKLRKSVYDGLAWLNTHWDVDDNPGQPGNWPFYWLYGLERCARLAGVENVGTHDWYVEGARRLLADQRANGSWPQHQRMRPPGGQNTQWWSDQVDTAFAVLFLARATPELDIPAPAITGGD